MLWGEKPGTPQSSKNNWYMVVLVAVRLEVACITSLAKYHPRSATGPLRQAVLKLSD